MALFQKKTVPISVPTYSIGHHDAKLIVGLGNPGKKYASTRHNMGFACIDSFAEHENFNPWVEKKDLRSQLCATLLNGTKVILCKPQTYMNLSGEAVRQVATFYRISPSNICIVYDELDLGHGTIRTGSGGSAAGHNGVKSVLDTTEDTFWRIRVGIGPKHPPQIDAADYVLQRMTQDELDVSKLIVSEVSNLIYDWLSGNSKPDTRTVIP